MSDPHFLKTIVADAPQSIALFDRDVRYLAASRRWIAEFGGGRGSLEGVRHYDLFPQLPAPWHEVHRRALAGETLSSDEDSFEREDGRRSWLRWSVCG